MFVSPIFPALSLSLSFSTLRFKNVMFDISPTEEVGDFEVKAKFMGVEMEKVQLHFQVNISPKNVRIYAKPERHAGVTLFSTAERDEELF